MKLIPLMILLLRLSVDANTQKNLQEQFSFPPQFPTPNSAVFTSDSSVYLPPESQSPIPYFSIKNVNNLPFQYLPPTGTKAPSIYPTPFPMLMSSTLVPNFDDDDYDDRSDAVNIRISSRQPPFSHNLNHTEKGPGMQAEGKREIKSILKTVNYQRPMEGIDMKFPTHLGVTKSPTTNQTPASRRMIMTAEFQKNEQIPDQHKSASFQGPQYIPAQGVFVSPTTEPAIPILRLSNEMDLDGSFSYEALGADQTHYVQHSRMENMGTDKEEQVVEGSYSYVGDNGQTYTVHYVADANGFRASGDHLPVAPPIPEIIQRSIQYNLAEEARRPPHLKSWQDEETERDIGESEKRYNFAAVPQRSLFTGRQPEAFSFNFPQGSNSQNNAASSKLSVKINSDFTKDQTQSKISGTISPQVTFLASQGARVPSLNTAQQSIARMFTTEKSTMPQLINYEATSKESDKENNKALWRWQYGLNANNENQISNKNSVSRSFGETDDIVINFNDMTPEQYTKMIQSQLETNVNSETSQYEKKSQTNGKLNNNLNTYYQNEINNLQSSYRTNINNQNSIINENKLSTESSNILPRPEMWYQPPQNYNTISYQLSHSSVPTHTEITRPMETEEARTNSVSNSKIITENNFTPPSQIVTKSYDYEDISYEPKRIKNFNVGTNTQEQRDVTTSTLTPNHYDSNNFRLKVIENEVKTTTTQEPLFPSTIRNIKFSDFIQNDENKNNFMPTINTKTENEKPTTTPENFEDVIRKNIFLKNFVRSSKHEQNIQTKINDESNEQSFTKSQTEAKTNKLPKFVQTSSKSINELKGFKRKPLDISEILNFVAMKNHFESSKVKPKNKPIFSNNYNQKNEIRYYENKEDNQENISDQNSVSYRPTFDNTHQELRGVIKNYKVLQRNNNLANVDQDISYFRNNQSSSMKTSQNPPLGRAGPSMKSYLPPIFV